MNRHLAHEHHTHPLTVGTIASGFIGAGGTASFRWDGEVWRPEGRTDAAVYLGCLTDHDLRRQLQPDLATLSRLGPHWAEHGTRQFVVAIEED
jgi:hypothetical protein